MANSGDWDPAPRRPGPNPGRPQAGRAAGGRVPGRPAPPGQPDRQEPSWLRMTTPSGPTVLV